MEPDEASLLGRSCEEDPAELLWDEAAVERTDGMVVVDESFRLQANTTNNTKMRTELDIKLSN